MANCRASSTWATRTMKKFLAALSFALLASACASSSDPAASSSAAETTANVPASTFVAICGFSLVSYDPTDTLRFYVESSFASDKLTLAMTMLPGWDNDAGAPKAPSVVTRAEAVGATLTSTSDVTSGAFTAKLGALDIPGVANPLNGADGHVEGLELDGQITAAAAPFCANVAGELTTPLDFDLSQAGTMCLFIPVKDGDPLPDVQPSDFHCP